MTNTEQGCQLIVATEPFLSESVASYVRSRRAYDPNPFLSEAEARWIFQHLILSVDYALTKDPAILPIPITLNHYGLSMNHLGPLRIPKLQDLKPYDSNPLRYVETLHYIPPELRPDVSIRLSQEDRDKVYAWSLGISLYFLLFARFPFDPDDSNWSLVLDQATLKLLPDVSSLMKRMLDPNPLTRIFLSDVIRSSWLKTVPDILNINDRLIAQQEPWSPPYEMESIQDIFNKMNGTTSSKEDQQ